MIACMSPNPTVPLMQGSLVSREASDKEKVQEESFDSHIYIYTTHAQTFHTHAQKKVGVFFPPVKNF